MKRQVQLRIRPDGTIHAETLGFHGEACLDVFPLLEKLLDAEAVDSSFKPEYYQKQHLTLEEQQRQQIKQQRP